MKTILCLTLTLFFAAHGISQAQFIFSSGSGQDSSETFAESSSQVSGPIITNEGTKGTTTPFTSSSFAEASDAEGNSLNSSNTVQSALNGNTISLANTYSADFVDPNHVSEEATIFSIYNQNFSVSSDSAFTFSYSEQNAGATVYLEDLTTNTTLFNVTDEQSTATDSGILKTGDSYYISYFLSLQVDATNTIVDSDNYPVNFDLTLVPEPSTYTMMLGGLALLGFCVRRKAVLAS